MEVNLVDIQKKMLLNAQTISDKLSQHTIEAAEVQVMDDPDPQSLHEFQRVKDECLLQIEKAQFQQSYKLDKMQLQFQQKFDAINDKIMVLQSGFDNRLTNHKTQMNTQHAETKQL